MSSAPTTRTSRLSVKDIRHRNTETSPLVCLTAYTAPIATIVDEAADIILVGDSLGTVLYGYDSTIPVTIDMMILHAEAVVRNTSRALVITDMPFGSYEESKEQALHNAIRIMKETGCQAVKIEGGAEKAETVAFLTQNGIPVCGHIGMRPQHSAIYGGFVLQGKTDASAAAIIEDARAISEAGALMIVLEAVPASITPSVRSASSVPLIGIGAGGHCDGQILVTEDMIGAFEGFRPKFVRRYAEHAQSLRTACQQYASDVREGIFPGIHESY